MLFKETIFIGFIDLIDLIEKKLELNSFSYISHIFYKNILTCCELFDKAKIIGAVAQLGERMTGSHEVRGSNPLSSIPDEKIKGFKDY